MPSKIKKKDDYNRTFRKRTDDEIKEALKEYGGLLTPAAIALGYADRTSLEERLRNNPVLKAYQVQCIEADLDDIESNLINAAKIDKDMRAIEFYLKSKGKHRGYGDSMQITSINANVNYSFDLNRLEVEEVAKLYELITRATIKPVELADPLPDGKELMREELVSVCENSVEGSVSE